MANFVRLIFQKGQEIYVVMKRLNRQQPFHVFYNTLACDLARESGRLVSHRLEKAYTNTLSLPLVSSDHLGQRGEDGQLGRAEGLTQI